MKSILRRSLHVPSAALLALALGLTSCMTVDPYTGEEKVSKSTQGAVGGAAAGALLGAVIGNNVGDGDAGRGALIGAALGGLAGGAVGASLDQQEAALRQRLRASGVSVTRRGNVIILNMPHDITFSSGRDSIRPQFQETLNSVAIVLTKYKNTIVHVHGHTDSDGSSSYNQSLSLRRAQSVGNYLGSRGVSYRRLAVRGFGESNPIASNNSSSGKARNRRVEIQITPAQR